MRRRKILVINLELVDTRDNRRLWGKQYNREASDLLILVADISQAVPLGLRRRLTGAEQQKLGTMSTANSDAYQFYLKGRYFLYGRGANAVKAVEYFEKAIQADPNYARAHAGLSFAYLALGLGDLAPGEAGAKAKEAARRAIEIDPMLAEAHTTLGQLKINTEWDFAGGLKEFERALELNPDDEEANEFYGINLGFMDRHEEAIGRLKRALQINPYSSYANLYLGYEYKQAGQHDMAIEQFKNTLELNLDRGSVRLFLAETYEEKKMYKEAWAELKKTPPDDQWTITNMGYVYAVTGKRDEAKKMLRKILTLSKKRNVVPAWVALVYTGLGQKDKAFKWLLKGYFEHSPRMVMIKHDSRFDSLRSDPRFHLMPEFERHQ
jgi:tetratricopeptide (TPR) repeat protein